MANLSDFLPLAGGGGGGFTRRLKYSTAAALNDADYNNAASYTVNPTSDLGLEDGASLGYFMVGGGEYGEGTTNTVGSGGRGGRIIYGIAIIVNASTDLILTIGTGRRATRSNYNWSVNTAPSESTISGGLTLTTADGAYMAGTPGYAESSYRWGLGGSGISGYGVGGGPGNYNYYGAGNYTPEHGWGGGGRAYNVNQGGVFNVDAADGAIIIYY